MKRLNQQRRRRRVCHAPILRFSPTAWAKLIYLRDCGPTEIGGFGIAGPDQPLLINDLQLVRQHCTAVSVAFDDNAVADYFDDQVGRGLLPAQFARIWIHTHPGHSPMPSGTDEATFGRVFGGSDWAVMFILARTGRTYARLRFGVGPGGSIQIPVEVDYSLPFAASDHEAWQSHYRANVVSDPLTSKHFSMGHSFREVDYQDHDDSWQQIDFR